LEGGMAAAKRIERISDRQFKIILTQGWKRQIRRMVRAAGNEVADLQRIRIAKLKLGDLPEGDFRLVSKEKII